MSKTFKNREWLKIVLENHQPRYIAGNNHAAGTIACRCSNADGKYTDHIIKLIDKEFPYMIEYNEKGTDYFNR